MAIGLRTIMRVIIVFTVVLISTVVLLKIAGYTGPLLEWNIFGPIPGDSEQPLAATPQLAVNIANAFRDSVSKEEDEISFEGMPEGYSLVYGLVKGEGDTINPISFVVAEKNVRLGKQDLSLFGLERRGDGIAIEDDKKAFQVSDESEFFWQMKSSYLPEGIQDCFDNPSPAECELEQEPDIYVTFVLSGSKELYYSNRHNVRRGSGYTIDGATFCKHDDDCSVLKENFKLFYRNSVSFCKECSDSIQDLKEIVREILNTDRVVFSETKSITNQKKELYNNILIYGLYNSGSGIVPAFIDFTDSRKFTANTPIEAYTSTSNIPYKTETLISNLDKLKENFIFEIQINEKGARIKISGNNDADFQNDCEIFNPNLMQENSCALFLESSYFKFEEVRTFNRLIVPFSNEQSFADEIVKSNLDSIKENHFIPVIIFKRDGISFIKRNNNLNFHSKSNWLDDFGYTSRRKLSTSELNEDPRNKDCHGLYSINYLFFREKDIVLCPRELADFHIRDNNNIIDFFNLFQDEENKIRGTIDLYHFRPADENEWKIIGFFSTGSADNPLSEPEFKPYLLTLEDAKIPYINQLGNIYFDKYSPNEIQHLFYGNSKKDNSDFIDGYFENRDISFKYYIQRLYSDDSSPGFFIYYSEGNGFPNNFYPLSDDYIFYPVILLNNEYAYYRTWSSSVFNLNKFDNFLLHYLRIPPQDVIESLDSGFYYKYSRHALETQSVFLYSES
jgi:hypothetical protein